MGCDYSEVSGENLPKTGKLGLLPVIGFTY
jgi:hypothetical protein